MNEFVAIRSSDFWVKIVAMLQQNWAVIEPDDIDAIRIYFIDDVGGVFDEIPFSSKQVASDALARNGFRRFLDHPDLQSFLRPPSQLFRRTAHPNGPIYSSGRFWRP